MRGHSLCYVGFDMVYTIGSSFVSVVSDPLLSASAGLRLSYKTRRVFRLRRVCWIQRNSEKGSVGLGCRLGSAPMNKISLDLATAWALSSPPPLAPVLHHLFFSGIIVSIFLFTVSCNCVSACQIIFSRHDRRQLS